MVEMLRVLAYRRRLYDRWRLLGMGPLEAIRLGAEGLTPLLPISGGADTEFGTGAAEAVKRWATEVWREAPFLMTWGKFIGKDANSIIQDKSDLEGKPGDQITCTFSRKLAGDGTTDDADLEGQEEQLRYYSDTVTLSQRRNAVRLKGRMSERRTAFNQRQDAKDHLKSWMAETTDNDLYTKMTDSPAASRTVYPGAVTAISGLAAGNVISTVVMDRVKAMAKKADPKVWPVAINGQDWYVLLIHTDVAYDLEQDTIWHAAQRDAQIRGDENPIFTGRHGTWRGIVLHEHEKVPVATDGGAAGNIAWASNIFMGQQAGFIAFGMRPEAWEKEFDYGAKVGFAIGAIWGSTKAVFNAVDRAVFEVRTARTNN